MEDTYDYIYCRVCHTQYGQLHPLHLQHRHGITFTEYQRRFPDAPTISQGHRDRISASKIRTESMKTPGERAEVNRKISTGHASISPERKAEISRIKSENAREMWMSRSSEEYNSVMQKMREGVLAWRRDNPEAVEEMESHHRQTLANMTDEELTALLASNLHSDYAKSLQKKHFAEEDEVSKKRRLDNSFHTNAAKLKSAQTKNRPPSEAEWLVGLYLERTQPGKWGFNGSGNLGIILGGKRPDFVNRDEKRIIETFGDYYHDPIYYPKAMTPEERIAHFAKYDYDCIVLWDYECYSKESLDEELARFMS